MPRNDHALLPRVVCPLLLASLVACVKTHVGPVAASLTAPRPAGATLSVDGKQYRLVGCQSGDRDYFSGVDLRDETRQAVVRLVIDPMDGPRLKVMDGGQGSARTLTLGRSSCRTLEAEVEPTAWRVNRVRDVNGLLEAECTGDGGVEVSVHVHFTHCH